MRLFVFLAIFMMVGFSIARADTEIDAMPRGVYTLDPAHASITWKVSHMGLSNYTARFTKMDSQILLDPDNLENSKVKATVYPSSVRTDYPNVEEKDFDKNLSEDATWFNTKQFPEIKFFSTKVEKTSDTTGKVTGNLTFLGVKKEIVLDVTSNKALGNHPFVNKPALGFSATTTIKRSDFGMTSYIPQIGDEVQVIIEAEYIYAE